jgi:hypothetical protein
MATVSPTGCPIRSARYRRVRFAPANFARDPSPLRYLWGKRTGVFFAAFGQERCRFSQRWIPVWGGPAISPLAVPVLVGSPLRGPGSLNVIGDSHVPKQQLTGTPGKKPPAGRRRRQLVARNHDNGAPRLPCRHAIQRSQPASHLALPAATIGKYPTVLIRRSVWAATRFRRNNRRRSHGQSPFGYGPH